MNQPLSKNAPDTCVAESTPHRAWIAGCVGALGGLLFGYDWVVIGGAKSFYEAYFHIHDPMLEAWVMSCALLGCLIGTLISGALSDRKGRRWMLMVSAVLFAITSLGTAASSTVVAFVLWRILGGCAIGAASEVAPLFLAEIAPTELRASFVSLNQMAIVFGILAAQCVNWFIARPVPAGINAVAMVASWNAQWGWRWMFGITAIPSTLFLLTTFWIPESPRWLLANFRVTEAMYAFQRLGFSDLESTAIRQTLMHGRVIESEASRLPPSKGSGRNSQKRVFLRILLLGMLIAILQQWCGINIIFSYAQDVFVQAGYTVSQSLFQIVLTGAVNLLFTLLALRFVDRLGRRILLLGGLASLSGIYILLGWMIRAHQHGAPVAALVLAAIAVYAMTLAPVSWVVIAEIYPARIRARSMAITVAALWIASFALTSSFPLIRASIGIYRTFWLYAIICACGACMLALWLPETRGYSLENIEGKLYRQPHRESA